MPEQPMQTTATTGVPRRMVTMAVVLLGVATLAGALLGEEADELIDRHRQRRGAAVFARLRVMMTTRSRYTEDRLAAAVQRGVDQYVLLGAGLDSFAYRSPLALVG